MIETYLPKPKEILNCNLCADSGITCEKFQDRFSPSRIINVYGAKGVVYQSIENCFKRQEVLRKAGV